MVGGTAQAVICGANIFGIGGHVRAIANRFETLCHDKWLISWNIGDDIERSERFDSDKSVWTTITNGSYTSRADFMRASIK